MSCGIAWQARHGASSSPVVPEGFPAYLSGSAARLLIGVSVFREPADRNALLFQVGEEEGGAAPGASSQDPAPPYQPPANLAELVSECEATSLLIVPRVPRGLGRVGTEIPPVFVDRRIASALHKGLAAAGRSDEVVQAHERAADYWQWRAAAWPQDQDADLHDLLEARHHRHEAGDHRQAGVLTEIVCAQLHAWGELDREAALIQEILAWLPARSPLRATWIQEIGKIAQVRGNYAEAERRYQQSLDIFASVGDTPAVSRSHHHLGVLAQAQGDYGEAERRYRQSGNVTGPAALAPGSTGRAGPGRGGPPGPGGPLTARRDPVAPARQAVRPAQQVKQGQAARLSQRARAAQAAQLDQTGQLADGAQSAHPAQPGQAIQSVQATQSVLTDQSAQSAQSALATPTATRTNQSSQAPQPTQTSQPTRTAPARRSGHAGQAALAVAESAGQLGIPGKIAGPIRNPGTGPGTRNPPGQTRAAASAGARRVRHTAGHTASPARRSGRTLWAAAGTAAVLAAVIAGNVTGFLPGGDQPGQSSTSEAAHPSAAALAAAVRSQAAQWANDQLSSGAVISCDPAMCAALRAHHYPEAQLVLLDPSSPDPLGSDAVMATAAVRNQFGRRLTTVYAPVVEAVIGAGKARIQIRAIAPDGSGAFARELRADLQQRRTFGAALLHNQAVSAPAPVRHQLAAGLVDARLLDTLALLADTHPLHIVDFVGAGPGASPGVPSRAADISGAGQVGEPALSPKANDGFLRSVLAFLQAQRPPYLALKMHLTRRNGQPDTVRLEFGAPSPLGLLASGTGEPDSQP
jgi:tetratricopeptide (TPR) repeat protein